MDVRADQLLDSIYAAALDPGSWQHVLAALGDVAGGEAGVISQLNIATGTGSAIVLNNDARTLDDYFNYYYRINPLQIVDDPASYVVGWTPMILRDEDWLDRATLESSEYYNDFLRPVRAEWGIILRIGLSGHDLTAISIGRSHGRGRFEDAEIAAVARFHPHLIRAIGLGRRFADVHRRSNGLAAAVDRSRSAMLLVDADARLLHANAAAERLIRAGDALRLQAGMLIATDPTSAASLSDAIRNASHQDRQRRIAGSFAIRTADRPLPLNGAAMPLLEEESSLFARAAATLVSIADPDGNGAGVLQSAFDFTAAESRLAGDLLEGLSLRVSAERRGVSINTVRTQLAGLFAKTGTHRQTELIQTLTMTDVGRFDA